MNTQVESNSNEHHRAIIEVESCRPEYQDSTQFSGVGGISFTPLHLLKRTALVTSLVVVGTIPPPSASLDLASHSIEASFVFPSLSVVNTEDEYSRIREEIVASGLPLLNDDEIRTEIRERKSSRGDTDS